VPDYILNRTLGELLTDGSQATQLVDDAGSFISVQNPIPTDGDSVYTKDIDLTYSTKVGWTGNIADLFINPNELSGITNATATNPKVLYLAFNRVVYLNKIGIGCNTGKTFSNVKFEFIGSDGTVRNTYDDSANNTQYGTMLYHIPVSLLSPSIVCIGIKVSFCTTNEIGLTSITIRKEIIVSANMQGTDEDTGVVQPILTSAGQFNVLSRLRNATGNTKINPSSSDNQGKFRNISDGLLYSFETVGGKPRVSSTPYAYDIAEGNIVGHTAFAKYGRVAGVNNLLVDVWAGEGGSASVYVFPPSAIKFTIASTSGNDDEGSTGIEKIMISGLDTNYAEQTEEVTLNGTADVVTTKNFLRINYCYATQAGANGVAAGVITIKNAAKTITYSSIETGLTACRTLVYTVPVGKTLYLTSLTMASGAGGNAIKLNAVVFTPKIRVFGSTVFIPQGEFMTINGDTLRPLEFPAVIAAKSDVKMSVQGDYASGATLCIAAVRGWIETI
jgi:hypothetical protein